MIKLNYGHLRDEGFNETTHKLFTFCGFDAKTAHRLMRIRSKIVAEAQVCQKVFFELVDKYALKDEAGQIVPINGKDGKPIMGTFQTPPEKTSEWNTELEKFKATEFEIDNEPVDLQKLELARLSPVELAAIQPLYKI